MGFEPIIIPSCDLTIDSHDFPSKALTLPSPVGRRGNRPDEKIMLIGVREGFAIKVAACVNYPSMGQLTQKIAFNHESD